MITLDDITLPDDLSWTDELSWSPVVQSMEYTLGGSIVVEEAVMSAGRPITLASPGEDVWITRAELLVLRALATTPGKEMILSLWGQEYTVIFHRGEGDPVEVTPVHEINPHVDADNYVLNFVRLMEI